MTAALPFIHIVYTTHFFCSFSGLISSATFEVEVLPDANPCDLLPRIKNTARTSLDLRRSDEVFQNAFALVELLAREGFVDECLGGSALLVEVERDYVFSVIDVVWGFESFHSITRTQVRICAWLSTEKHEWLSRCHTKALLRVTLVL